MAYRSDFAEIRTAGQFEGWIADALMSERDDTFGDSIKALDLVNEPNGRHYMIVKLDNGTAYTVEVQSAVVGETPGVTWDDVTTSDEQDATPKALWRGATA